jgi:4-amino-4-deoxy-L-arabinose transferase-like glycosyltransferase
MSRARGSLPLAWGALFVPCALALLWLRRSALDEPHLWDALGCYVAQARFIAHHGLDFSRYAELGFVRPPLFTGTLAAVMRAISESRQAMHVTTLLFCAAILPSLYLLTRRLGGSPMSALVAVILCVATPSFFAQSGLVHSDLPATAFTTLAWLLLLRGQHLGFALATTLGVLTKESAYFVCVPAALWLLWQQGQSLRSILSRGPLRGRWLSHAVRLWPAIVPIVVLASWQLAQRFLVGAVLPSIYAGYVGPGNLPGALLHNLANGGRLFLLLAALPVLRAAWGSRDPLWPGRDPVLLTALAVFLLPFLFPTPLPRYQLPSLPLLCALSALGLFRLPAQWRLPATAVVLALLIAGLNGLWFRRDNAHQEVSLAYRAQLRSYQDATRFLAAARPRAVIAGFPMSSMLTAPPADGFLAQPVPVIYPSADLTTLCRADYLVEAQDDTVGPVIQRLGRCGALALAVQLASSTPVFVPGQFQPLDAERDRAIRIYRVSCPARCP